MRSNVLEVSNLSVVVGDAGHHAVENIVIRVRQGERVALVGESGSGKSVTANALTRLIEHKGGRILPDSRISIVGEEVVSADRQRLQHIRAGKVGMVFQDPLMSLNPSKTIGRQISESAIQANPELTKKDARDVSLELLEAVGIRTPEQSYEQFPHEFSGGMRQRVMIAIALACEPDLLIADEPTTALDVTIQKQILELLDRLVSERGLAVLLITHDMGVVAQYTDYVHVMYAGEIIEQGPTRDVLKNPSHPYTSGLIKAVPTLDHPRGLRLEGIPGSPPAIYSRPKGCRFNPRCLFSDGDLCVAKNPELMGESDDSSRRVSCHYPLQVDDSRFASHQPSAARNRSFYVAQGASGPLLSATGVNKVFGSGGSAHHAVKDVSLTVSAGETLGIVGESGSGKSTLARCLLRLEDMDSGSIHFNDADLTASSGRRLRRARREIQMVFQDPFSSLDPRFPVGRSLAEPLRIHGLWGQRGYDEERLNDLMRRMALQPEDLVKYPREFSGGQLQRIAIMRALTLRPKLIALDEPVSSLDVSTQAEIISLLEDIQLETGIAYLFIAHDLAVVRHISDRIMVMRNGTVVESGTSDQVIHQPSEPYTKALLSAVPSMHT